MCWIVRLPFCSSYVDQKLRTRANAQELAVRHRSGGFQPPVIPRHRSGGFQPPVIPGSQHWRLEATTTKPGIGLAPKRLIGNRFAAFVCRLIWL